MKIKTITILPIMAMALFFQSCSTDQDSVNDEEAKIEEEYFFLKNLDNSYVSHVEKEMIEPIYNDLKEAKGEESAEAFLNTYDSEGDVIPELPSINDNILTKANEFSYGYHMKNLGWLYNNDNHDDLISGHTYELGVTGQTLHLEAFYMDIEGVNLKYEVHLSWTGWQGTKENGDIAGSTGAGVSIEAFHIWLDEGYAYYKAHLGGSGWETSWTSEGGIAGTEGQTKRIEALQVRFYLY